MTARLNIFIFAMAISGLTTCKLKEDIEVRDDFKKFYDTYQLDGSFSLYDERHDQYILYHQDQFVQAFIPASTFKICNSLIGLETGVIPDEHFVISWDSVTRNPVWDKDHDLRTAFRNSTVWYYQELARRVGGERMKYWLEKANYANADTSGGIDQFWLTGGLRITPGQQIDFLKRLHDNKLPFSQRSMDIVKDIMIVRDTLDYVIRGKLGWGGQGDKDIGWYVGYLETKDNVYYFANCIQTESNKLNDMEHAIQFDHARRDITFQILDELKLTSQ